MSRKAPRSGGTKVISARLARSIVGVGRANLEASAMLVTALRAATTTCGGFSDGGTFDNMTDSAPAAWIGARKAKPPVSGR